MTKTTTLTWSKLRPGLVQLSRSQGIHGRLLENLDSMPVREINKFLKDNNVRSVLDFIFVIEG